MKTGRVRDLGMLFVLAVAAASCKSKTELTCRWMTLGPQPENLQGSDPAIALTGPWTDLGLKTDKATVCQSTPTQVKLLYKGSGDWFEAFTDLKESLESKGYKMIKFDGESAKVKNLGSAEATLERASDKSELQVKVSCWPKDAWKSEPYDVSITRSTSRSP